MWISKTIGLGELALPDGRVITADLEVELEDALFKVANLCLDEEPAEETEEIRKAIFEWLYWRLTGWRSEHSDGPVRYRRCHQTGFYEAY